MKKEMFLGVGAIVCHEKKNLGGIVNRKKK
jgi:hypothetical protein